MTDQGLRAIARGEAPKLGNFVVEFATPGVGDIL